MTKQIQTHLHGEQPVTDAWHAQNIAPFPGIDALSSAELEWQINAHLQNSNAEALTDGEEATLQALTRVRNVNKALAVLKGRTIDEFGFEGADQVHGNSIGLDCGCTLHAIFDHHKAQAGDLVEHHPHHPIRVCKDHAHLRINFKAHFAQALADHEAKASEF